MRQVISKEFCSGCGNCELICPKHAIAMQQDKCGHNYSVINKKTCIDCGMCLSVCPQNDMAMSSKPNQIIGNHKYNQQYAFINHDEDVLKKSSSGGAFVKISNKLLDDGYVVYGAAFDDTFSVVHSMAVNQEQRDRFCGSKYVPSKLGGIFVEIAQRLKCNNPILFSGTPCQCKALWNYMIVKNVPTERMFTVDFKCHGSGNVKVWDMHKQLLEQQYGKIVDYTFRDKGKSWEHYPTKATFESGKIKLDSRLVRLYTILFLKQYVNMPLCYHCPYRKEHYSDITMSDFWAVREYDDSLYNKNGVSLLSSNSEKGEKLIKALNEQNEFNIVHSSQISSENINRAKEYGESQKFFEYLEKYKYRKAALKYTRAEYYRSIVSELLRNIGNKIFFS